MTNNMPDDEFSKWVESFQKSRDGDDSMLIRIAPDVGHAGQTTTTTAPLDRRKIPSNISQASHPRGQQIKKAKSTTHKDRRVKREEDTEMNIPKTNTFTEQKLARPQTTKTKPAKGQPSAEEATEGHTPTIDLLSGRSPLSRSIWPQIVDTIMERLGHRIPTQVRTLSAP
jgi:hypothetical protein